MNETLEEVKMTSAKYITIPIKPEIYKALKKICVDKGIFLKDFSSEVFQRAIVSELQEYL